MTETITIAITVVTLVGIAGFLIRELVRSYRPARGRGIRALWTDYGLGTVFCILFLMSWAAHAVAEWGHYVGEQRTHGEPATIAGYVVAFGRATLENWQSEFLQLFAFVVLSAVLIHRGSAESKDSDDRIEAKLDAIAERLNALEARSNDPSG